ncbi:MAG: IPT/TIG domain-containing protein, partial [Proteobacteria bacterium]|nr:IPT/TIG domain-containing protein [Pseudomonadota bacterium]
TMSTNESAPDSGAAYVFKRTGSSWAQEAYLKAPNAGDTDFFGFSASISGDTIVVGAYGEGSNQTTITNGPTASDDSSLSQVGAAYVFKRTGSDWAQEAYLKASNAGGGDQFGVSASISGDTIVVGAAQEDSSETTITNGTTMSGAAYVYKRSGSTWQQEAYLKASNAGGGDQFGVSASISGDTIVVGAAQEDSSETTITNGTTMSTNESAPDSGAAYVFKRTGSSWAQEAYLKAPNAGDTDLFGFSASISGDTIVVGAYFEDENQTTITNDTTASNNNGLSNSGAAYVFRRQEVPSAPTVSSVIPTSGAPAGDNVIIFGSGFMKSASVTVGGSSCTTVTIQGPNEIICNLPIKPAGGAIDIVVTNPNSNGSFTLASAYTYP